ncbi:PRC-barrel domain-containing protein [Rhodobacter sp. NSM]|uniref:PRC-barrel domain-containing protein n=1 Tax=Rhodobacter sp. NSM TaxID=3457501 RepID=UPI003FD1CC5E
MKLIVSGAIALLASSAIPVVAQDAGSQTGTMPSQTGTMANRTGTTANETGTTADQAGTMTAEDWSPNALYASGMSAQAFMNQTEVYGSTGDDIGDVEDLVIGPDGRILSVIVEVGGVWDIGDTHVSVPWDQVEVRDSGGITVPVTEETVDDFG